MTGQSWSYTDVTWPALLSPARAIALQTQLHLRNTLTLRRMWPYLLLIALPIAAAAGLSRLSLHSDSSVIGRFYHHFAMRALALCALGMGTAAIRDDAESGALPLHLLKPWAVVAVPVGRLLAVTLLVTALGVAMMAGTTASLVGTLYSPDVGYVLRQVLAALFGGFAYAAIYLAMGAWFKSATALGLGFLVGIDLVAAPYWDLAAKLSPSHYIGVLVRTLPGRELVAAATADQVPGALVGLTALGLMAAGLAVWRMRGDVPG